MSTEITFALTKGRILKETLPLLAEAGIEPTEDIDSSRRSGGLEADEFGNRRRYPRH